MRSFMLTRRMAYCTAVAAALVVGGSMAMAQQDEGREKPRGERGSSMDRGGRRAATQPGAGMMGRGMAGNPAGPQDGFMRQLRGNLEELNLNAEQKEKIKTILQDAQAKNRTWQEEHKAELESLRADFEKATQDKDQAKLVELQAKHRQLMGSVPMMKETHDWMTQHEEEIKSLREEMRAARQAREPEKAQAVMAKMKELMDKAPQPMAELVKQVKAVLTPEQVKILDEKLAKMREGAMGGPMGGPPMMGRRGDEMGRPGRAPDAQPGQRMREQDWSGPREGADPKR